MLNFVNPLFAWLALAASIPLIIHLLNRRRYQQVRWAAMDFLLKALHKNRRRLQMESLILLLLRMLIVTILAFVLARPYLKGSALFKEPDTHLVIAIDNSYSMGYRPGMSTLFEDAKKIASGLMEQLKPEKGDKLSLITISSKPEILISESSYQMAQAKNKLANLGLTDYATDISKTLALAQEILSKSKSSSKVLYLVTDNQRAGWNKINTFKESLGAIPIDSLRSLQVKIIQVGPADAGNNLISRIYTDKSIVTARKPVTFYAEVKNYSSADTAPSAVKVNFSVQGQKYASSTVVIPRNNLVLVPFAHTFNEPGQYWIKVELENDNLLLDDSRLYSVAVKEGINTLIINGESSSEPSEDEILFLRSALSPAQPSSGDSFSPYLIDTATANQFINTDKLTPSPFPLPNGERIGEGGTGYNLIILANVEFLSDDKVGQIENYVRSGGGLLVFLGDRVNKTAYNESLYKNGAGLLPCQLGEIKGDPMHNEVVRFGEIDFTHPALSFFSPIKERFNTLAIYQYYKMEDSAAISPSILARLNYAGNPALIAEKPFGNGRVMVIGTSADTEWNLMPVRPMYLMLIDQIGLYLASFSEKALNRNLIVGEPIEMTVESKSANYTLRLPKKESISLAPVTISSTFLSSVLRYDTRESGLYTLTGAGQERFFAINPDPVEGDLRKISAEELKNLIPASGLNNPKLGLSGIEIISAEGVNFKDVSNIATSGAEAPWRPYGAHPIWKHLIYILLVSVGLEMLLAWRFGRR